MRWPLYFLCVLTGGATSALKATGYGARVVSVSSKVSRIVGSLGDDLVVGVRRLLNDVDDALFPQQIVTPDGRKFQVRRNDVLEGDKSQRMKMEGKNNGSGSKRPMGLVSPKKANYDWKHIESGHSDWGDRAIQSKKSEAPKPKDIFEGLSSKEIQKNSQRGFWHYSLSQTARTG